MPYKDPERQKQAAAEYARRKKKEWLGTQTCRDCGKPGPDLHVFGAKKKGASAFTCREERRAVLLADAYCLCDQCVGQHQVLRRAAIDTARRELRRKPEAEKKRGPKPKVQKAPVAPIAEILASRSNRREWREQRRREMGYGR